MTVEEYDQEFDVLSYFTPKFVGTEVARSERFVRGLTQCDFSHESQQVA